MIKTLFNAAFDLLPFRLQNRYRVYKNTVKRDSIIRNWEARDKPLPPPHQVKQMAIEYYQSMYGYQTLIETGTYLGNMVLAQKDKFSRIYSIELGENM